MSGYSYSPNKIITLSQLLELQAAKYDNKTYLYWEDQKISYKDVNKRANQVANALQAAGVKHSNKVGILTENNPEFIYTFFACAKIGAIVVPINFMLQAEEIQYACENSDMIVLIASSTFSPIFENIKTSLPKLRTIWFIGKEAKPSFDEVWSYYSPHLPKSQKVVVSPKDVMSIIYTSGTTGRPKGVLLSHENYLHDAGQMVLHLNIRESDRLMCFLPLFHVNAQVASTLGSLLSGASLILLAGFSPQTFLNAISNYKATSFSAVPTVYGILNTLPDTHKYDLSSLRFCLCGASPMPVEVFEEFERKYKAYIVEGFGQSEGTCWSTMNPLDGRPRKIGSIGLALEGQEVKIFDAHDKEVPFGQMGEIVIRGPNVMQGYYKNEEATKDTLKNGWLHSGDLGYIDKEGYVFITGRKKEMIIRGGENIYPKEIEEVLYRHPAVLECAIVGVPEKIWGEQVIAALILKEDKRFPEAEVIKYCQEHIAHYKCPTKITYHTKFPKTATGKIQKNKIVEELKVPKAKL